MFEMAYGGQTAGGPWGGAGLYRTFADALAALIAEARRNREKWAVTAQFPDALGAYDRWLDELAERTEPFTATLPESYITLGVHVATPRTE